MSYWAKTYVSEIYACFLFNAMFNSSRTLAGVESTNTLHVSLHNNSEFKAIYKLDVPFTAFYGIIDVILGAWKYKIKRHDLVSNVKRTCNAIAATS